MQKWEYGVLYPPTGDRKTWRFVSQGGEWNVGRGEEMEVLNELGAEGWELAGCIAPPFLPCRYCFKRPLL